MECKFQVGDPVVCVLELTEPEQHAIAQYGPVLDEVYHVRDVRAAATWNYSYPGMIGVTLVELVIPMTADGKEPCFNHTMFRRLITPEEFMSKDVGLPVDSGDKVMERV